MKNKILLSAITIPCVGITSAFSISCGGGNEVNSQQKQELMPLNYYVEDKSLSIFDESKWKDKELKDINLDFIKSTILENDKYKVSVGPTEEYVFKNEDLNYVSFMYAYAPKNETPAKFTNWFIQTVYFNNINIEKEISLDEYWKLAEEKGQSSNTSGGSLYKYSFDSSTSNYTKGYIDEKWTSSEPRPYYNMPQKMSHYVTTASYVAKEAFLNKYGMWSEASKLKKQVQTQKYTKDNDYFYQDFITYNGNRVATITFLSKDVKIKSIDREDSKYIKFEMPVGSIKVTVDGQDYLSDFSDSLYINITSWK